jgi:septum formation protein
MLEKIVAAASEGARPALRPKLVLASGSARRLALLQQAGLEPDALLPADVDETPARSESSRELARRLARGKAEVARRAARNRDDLKDAFIVSADTVVTAGRRILPKAEVIEEAAACLRLLSGRAHRVYTSVCVITPKDAVRERLVETRVRFKRLSREETESYLASGEWRGKAGGYAIQGLAGSFVVKLVGSYSNVVGLPIYETVALLDGAGFPVRLGWLNAA